jgi:hypothetical protein
MHLFTRSARLSRFSRALVFSVRIQHSRAARECVIGPEFATGVCVRGVTALVQPVSGSVQANNKRTSVPMRRRSFTTVNFIFDGVPDFYLMPRYAFYRN